MAFTVVCKLCGKRLLYNQDNMAELGEHHLIYHPNENVSQFAFESTTIKPFVMPLPRKEIDITMTRKPKKNNSNSKTGSSGRKRIYKTTVETWKSGPSHLLCPSCQKVGPPLIRKKRNKIAHSPLGALCMLGCWPLCFLPLMLGRGNIMNLYCKTCGQYLGKYNVRANRLELLENVKLDKDK